MKVRISTVRHKMFLLSIVTSIILTVFFFCLYAIGEWWMFFCCLFAFAIQGIVFVLKDIMFVRVTIDTETNDYQTILFDLELEEKRYKLINSIGIVLIILINTFPFFALNGAFASLYGFEPYEGGTLVTLITLASIGLWISELFTEKRINIRREFENGLNNRLKEQERIRIANEKKNTEENNIKSHYGDNAIVIKTSSTKVIFSERNKCVEIYGETIPFTSILSYSLIDNSKTESITTTNGDVKTSTNSMLGRAVVGGVLTGGLGAVAGAATAKKNISTDATSITTTTHDFILYVNVNSLQNPIITIHIGDNIEKSQKLAGLFNVIIERNRQ